MKMLPRLILLSLLLAFLYLHGQAQAAAPADYGREYGLYIHEENRNLAMPEIKGMQVLGSFFAEAPLKASAAEDSNFMSQRDFLLNFEKLRLISEGKRTRLTDEQLYLGAWLRARRNNWLPRTKLTYESFQEYLYRYEVSKKHNGRAYFEGLVLSGDDINSQRFTSLNQVREIKNHIENEKLELEMLQNPTGTTQQLLAQLEENYEAFNELEQELFLMEHPLNKIPNLPEEIRQKITQNGLNQVLDSISYNYAHNNANRIHNLTTGALRMSGRVFQPGEVMDFTEILGSDGWGLYKYGWVIFGGIEEWQFGGGLCGSATITFTPSWRAGLEIISRYPHSAYYRNLYPEDSLGLDATIYRGAKNLVMRNTTGSPLLYYVHDDREAKEITLYLIGNSPFVDIEIEGPISVGRNTYKWIRRMHKFDGTVIEDELVTKYGVIY